MSEKTHSQSEDTPAISDEALEKQREEQSESAESHSSSGTHGASSPGRDELLAEIKLLKQKADTQWDLAVRAKAEVENMRRRAERDVESAHKYGVEKILNDLLPVIDSLEQALLSMPQSAPETNPFVEGISLTLKMFSDTLEKYGVTPLQPEGEIFDPALHEAMSMLENQEVKPGTVLNVIQKGYCLHDRLLRPARVIVAKAATQSSGETA